MITFFEEMLWFLFRHGQRAVLNVSSQLWDKEEPFMICVITRMENLYFTSLFRPSIFWVTSPLVHFGKLLFFKIVLFHARMGQAFLSPWSCSNTNSWSLRLPKKFGDRFIRTSTWTWADWLLTMFFNWMS